jgi:hypothetical protein
MMMILKRSLRMGLPLLLLASGCKDNEEAATESQSTGDTTAPSTGTPTEAGDSDSGGGGGGSGGGTGTTQEQPTTGSDPTAPTTGEPVPCDTPEGCTAMGGGEVTNTTLPFFRGEVCISDKLRTGDPLAISVTTCVHPCLKADGYGFNWVYRCTDGLCEAGLVFYHPNVTGSMCPADVFGAFDPAGCTFTPPAALSIKLPDTIGDASLLMPFLTNDDAAAIDGGDSENAAIWARIDGHTQASERRLPLNFAAENPAPPATCAAGEPGCTCRKIGVP